MGNFIFLSLRFSSSEPLARSLIRSVVHGFPRLMNPIFQKKINRLYTCKLFNSRARHEGKHMADESYSPDFSKPIISKGNEGCIQKHTSHPPNSALRFPGGEGKILSPKPKPKPLFSTTPRRSSTNSLTHPFTLPPSPS